MMQCIKRNEIYATDDALPWGPEMRRYHQVLANCIAKARELLAVWKKFRDHGLMQCCCCWASFQLGWEAFCLVAYVRLCRYTCIMCVIVSPVCVKENLCLVEMCALLSLPVCVCVCVCVCVFMHVSCRSSTYAVSIVWSWAHSLHITDLISIEAQMIIALRIL